MSDAAFREALDAILELVENHSYAYAERDAMYARVLALYAERQGEVYEVENDEGGAPVILLPDTYTPGNKVCVTKVEEGR